MQYAGVGDLIDLNAREPQVGSSYSDTHIASTDEPHARVIQHLILVALHILCVCVCERERERDRKSESEN